MCLADRCKLQIVYIQYYSTNFHMVSKGNALGYSCINNGWRKMTGLDFDQSSHRISQSIEMNGKYIRPLHSSYPKCFLQSSLSQYYIKLSMWFSPDPKMHHHHRSQGRVPLICSTFVYDVPVYLHCCSNWLLGGCDMMTAFSLSSTRLVVALQQPEYHYSSFATLL